MVVTGERPMGKPVNAVPRAKDFHDGDKNIRSCREQSPQGTVETENRVTSRFEITGGSANHFRQLRKEAGSDSLILVDKWDTGALRPGKLPGVCANAHQVLVNNPNIPFFAQPYPHFIVSRYTEGLVETTDLMEACRPQRNSGKIRCNATMIEEMLQGKVR